MAAMADPAADQGELLLQFPSEEFPAPSPFRVTVPAGWRAIPTGDAHLAVGMDAVVDRFRPNVVVRVHRLARTGDADVALDVMLTGDDDLPALEVLDDERREGGQAPARRRLMRYVGPENTALEARRLMIFVPVSEHFADVVSAVGTRSVGAPADVAAAVDAVVDSLAVGFA